jgi:hypothetical protein
VIVESDRDHDIGVVGQEPLDSGLPDDVGPGMQVGVAEVAEASRNRL